MHITRVMFWAKPVEDESCDCWFDQRGTEQGNHLKACLVQFIDIYQTPLKNQVNRTCGESGWKENPESREPQHPCMTCSWCAWVSEVTREWQGSCGLNLKSWTVPCDQLASDFCMHFPLRMMFCGQSDANWMDSIWGGFSPLLHYDI